jgi:N-acetylmuramoyl-L-alanine amidase
LNVPRVTAKLEQAGTTSRLVFDVTPRTPYTVTYEPGRLLVRFDADALDASLALPAGGLVESVTSVEAATVAVGLSPKYGTHRASSVPLDTGAVRVVLDLAPAGSPVPPAVLPKPPQPPPPVPTPSELPGLALPPGPGIRTVVIDPGHGGDEPGARGPGGTLEKDITLDVARRLRSLIEGRLGIRVLLTRDDDRLVPLDERASIANNNKADLFLSLHANASPRADARGAEVFYLSLDGYEGAARRQAEHPPSRSLPALGGGSREVQLTVWEMAQAQYLAESGVLAGFVEQELRRRVEMSARSLQQAPLRVLVGANMPAVLVEMAFITNVDQEARLRSDEFKVTLAQALYDAVLRYRARVQEGAPTEADRPVPGQTPDRRAPWE